MILIKEVLNVNKILLSCVSKVKMTGVNSNVKMSGYGRDNLDYKRTEENRCNGEGI